jgi:hypothetical protein
MKYFVTLRPMSSLSTHIYTSADELPEGLLAQSLFHSAALFELCRQTPRQSPLLVTVEDEEGAVVSQLLAIVRYRSSWFPPYFYMHCRVYGEGAYAESDCPQEQLFETMLAAITRKMGRRVLYFEVSNLKQKMFGYRPFRQLGFFPVRWMSIHNSLHSRTPEERIGERLRQHIDDAYAKGVVTQEVATPEEFKAFSRLLRHHNWLKPKRYLPADEFFLGMPHDAGRLFITKYRSHVIGCSVVVYSEGQAYLWYSAFRRKSYAWLHPDEVTVWHAIKDAHRRGYAHIFFLDVGLPFRRNRFRDFILSFGGKPTSTYRWFRCTIGWMNSLLSWLYRD